MRLINFSEDDGRWSRRRRKYQADQPDLFDTLGSRRRAFPPARLLKRLRKRFDIALRSGLQRRAFNRFIQQF